MKKLLYKGIKFDDFQLYNGEPERYGDYNSESLDKFEGVDVYVCPHCIKKYNLYAECDTTEEEVNRQIKEDLECNYYDLVCGVKGCYNKNANDGYFSTEGCLLVDEEPDFTDGNFIDDAEKMRDFKILSKEEFLSSYSYLTEAEYDNTMEIYKKTEKDYQFTVTLCDGYMAKGTYTVRATTESEAHEKALTEICNKLYSVLPELDIEVSVSLVEDFEMENLL